MCVACVRAWMEGLQRAVSPPPNPPPHHFPPTPYTPSPPPHTFMQAKAIQRLVEGLCSELRGVAVPLVDAFAIPDHILRAPIGLSSVQVSRGGGGCCGWVGGWVGVFARACVCAPLLRLTRSLGLHRQPPRPPAPPHPTPPPLPPMLQVDPYTDYLHSAGFDA